MSDASIELCESLQISPNTASLLEALESEESKDFIRLHSKIYYISLTCGLGGLQVVWTTIFSSGTPFLLSLGLQKSCTALVWAAAPICGCFAQTLIGRLSDRSRHPWGRRRPFIAFGAAFITISIITLAWSDVLANLIHDIFFRDESAEQSPIIAQFISISSFWVLSLAIQPLQCGLRALIMDKCSSHQQSAANMWAATSTGLGNVLGCLVGLIELPGLSSHITQKFKVLSLIALFAVDTTSLITCLSISEDFDESTLRKHEAQPNFVDVIKELFSMFDRLPMRAYRVLVIQFISWFAWFGFLFYSANYINDLEQLTRRAKIIDTNYGTFTNLLIAVVALTVSCLLPSIAAKTIFSSNSLKNDSSYDMSVLGDPFDAPCRVWAFALSIGAVLSFTTYLTDNAVMGSTLMILMGIPWAVANWAPLTLYSIALQEVGPINLQATRHTVQTGCASNGALAGLYNIAVSAPQILAAVGCSLVISLSQEWGSTDSLGCILRSGGVAFAVGSYLAFRMRSSGV